MTRRWVLLALPAGLLGADTGLTELLERMTSALSEGDIGVFLDCFDESLPNYERFARESRGLMEQNDISSSVEIVKESEGEAEVDWTLVLRARAVARKVTERRGVVRLRWRRAGKKARITEFQPAEWFVPPRLG